MEVCTCIPCPQKIPTSPRILISSFMWQTEHTGHGVSIKWATLKFQKVHIMKKECEIEMSRITPPCKFDFPNSWSCYFNTINFSRISIKVLFKQIYYPNLMSKNAPQRSLVRIHMISLSTFAPDYDKPIIFHVKIPNYLDT